MTAAAATVDLTHTVTRYGAACYWAGVDARDRAGWLEARRNHLTASDMPAVLGWSKYKSPLAVYLEKVQPEEQPAPTIYDATFWGTVLERPILDAIAPHFGWTIHNYGGSLLVSRDCPELACTLDAEIEADGEELTYEGKTTQEWLHKEWDEEEGKAPTRVLLQVQTQLRVTLAHASKTFCLVGGRTPHLIHVEPNREIHGLVTEMGRTFMKSVRERAQPVASANDGDLLRHMYPDHRQGAVVRLPDDAAAWTAEIERCNAERAALKVKADELKNRIRQCIGDAEWGACKGDDGKLIAWRWQNDASGKSALRRITGEKSMPRINMALFELMEQARPRELVDDLAASLERASQHAEERKLPKPKRRQARR